MGGEGDVVPTDKLLGLPLGKMVRGSVTGQGKNLDQSGWGSPAEPVWVLVIRAQWSLGRVGGFFYSLVGFYSLLPQSFLPRLNWLVVEGLYKQETLSVCPVGPG